MNQNEFDMMIGRLDRDLSELMIAVKDPQTDDANLQTLKHHAEDMVAAGNRILEICKERKPKGESPAQPK